MESEPKHLKAAPLPKEDIDEYDMQEAPEDEEDEDGEHSDTLCGACGGADVAEERGKHSCAASETKAVGSNCHDASRSRSKSKDSPPIIERGASSSFSSPSSAMTHCECPVDFSAGGDSAAGEFSRA